MNVIVLISTIYAGYLGRVHS